MHGLENLHRFLKHVNSLHPSIKFTLEMQKEDKTIPFLDVLLIQQEDGSLGHMCVGNQHTRTGICTIILFTIL